MSAIDRRRFNAMVGTLGLTPAGSLFAAMIGKGKSIPAPEVLRLSRNGWMPNNPDLPVLIYHAVADGPAEQLASQMEAGFRQNGWPPQWREARTATRSWYWREMSRYCRRARATAASKPARIFWSWERILRISVGISAAVSHHRQQWRA
jgi:hypothetical protein